MDVTAILDELEAREIRVRVTGQALELVGPRGALSHDLAREIRRRKPDLLKALSLHGWPEASRDAVCEHNVPHARLYPFVGRTVVTPLGQGRLVQVSADRAVVQLVQESYAFVTTEVRPPGVPVQAEDHFEAVH